MRLIALLCLAACWRASAPTAHVPARTVSRTDALSIDRDPPGRLVIDRNGTAWQAHCDGSRLQVTPWQGGYARDGGPCAHRDTGDRDADHYVVSLSPLAIGERAIAIALESPRELVITSARGERRYPIGKFVRVLGIAIDGDAVVLVVTALPDPTTQIGGVSLDAALVAFVRITDRIAVTELVRYGSRGPEVVPSYVIANRDRLLLIAKLGGMLDCDYHGKCQPLEHGKTEIDGLLPTADGGAVTFDHDFSVSRIDARGRVQWTTKLSAFELVGATDQHVWVKTRPDDPRDLGMPIIALSLASGRRDGDIAIERVQRRDPKGRYLQIRGVAPTPRGVVVRGTFAGTLANARGRKLTTPLLGAVCWWENPHDGDEHSIDLGGTCQARYAKAIVTERAAFVAIEPRALVQR